MVRDVGKKQVSVRLDEVIEKRLRYEAEQRTVSFNWLVNKLLREGVERLEPIDS